MADTNAKAELEPGAEVPVLSVTPDKYVPAPLRGRVGRLQPDPHRPRVRHARSGCRRTSSTASTRWPRSRVRATQAAGGDPRSLKRLSVQFRGMGVPEQEIRVTGTVREARDGRVIVDTVAEQSGNQIVRNAEAELEPR